MITKQIVAGSGDLSPNFTIEDTQAEFGPIGKYILKLTNKPSPKLCLIATASGDSPIWIDRFYDACSNEDVQPSHLQLFKSPNHVDVKKFLLTQDAIWVSGGSSVNLIAIWQAHGLFSILREAWEKGIILSGYSAGSECWSAGGTTESFGPPPMPFVNPYGILPFSSGVHNDDPAGLRRSRFRTFVEEGKIPEGYATDEGVTTHFIGTKLHKVISDTEGKSAYYTYRGKGGELIEEKLVPEVIR